MNSDNIKLVLKLNVEEIKLLTNNVINVINVTNDINVINDNFNKLLILCKYGSLRQATTVIKNVGIPNELTNSEYIEQFITIWYNLLKSKSNYKLFDELNLNECMKVIFNYMNVENNFDAKIIYILLCSDISNYSDMKMKILEKMPLVFFNKINDMKSYKLIINKLNKISFDIDDYKNFIEKNMINNNQKTYSALDFMLSCCYQESTKLLNSIFQSIIRRSLYYGDDKYMDVHVNLIKNICGICEHRNLFSHLSTYLNINIIDKYYKFLPEMNYVKVVKYIDNLFIPNHYTDFCIILESNCNLITLYVNKIYLASKSEYFSNMFEKEMLESKNNYVKINCLNDEIDKYVSMIHLIHDIDSYQLSSFVNMLPISMMNKSLEYIISVNILCAKYMLNINLNKYYRRFTKKEIIKVLESLNTNSMFDGMNHLLFNQLIYWYIKNKKE